MTPLSRFICAAISGLCLTAVGPASAQQDPTPYGTFVQMVDRGDDRSFFGLPIETYWVRREPITISLYSPNWENQKTGLQGLIDQISGLCRIPIGFLDAAAAKPEASGGVAVVPDLEIIVGPRPEMARLAAETRQNQAAFERFEDGRWPFLFFFPRDDIRLGQVWVAQEEPAEAIEATLILALFQALGAATLGGELQGVVDRGEAAPRLSAFGESVVALLCHPELTPDLTIEEALVKAHGLIRQGG